MRIVVFLLLAPSIIGAVSTYAAAGSNSSRSSWQWLCVDFTEMREKANAGDIKAQRGLCIRHKLGIGDNLKPDAQKAAPWCRSAADAGDVTGQYMLGRMYQRGQGVEQDRKKAMEWYTKAAEQDAEDAQYRLARMYHLGLETERDHRKAAMWYERAAEQGHTVAQRWTGVMYELGLGVPQNYETAAEWYRRSANKGNRYAQRDLGDLYTRPAMENLVKAHMWFNLAGAQGDDHARERRDEIAQSMNPTQIRKAQELAKQWENKETGKVIEVNCS